MTDSLIPAYAAEALPVLRVTSRFLDLAELSPTGSLLEALPSGLASTEPLVWLRGDGLVGWGSAWRLDIPGSPFVAADERWRAVAAQADVSDSVGQPGSGLVAFGSFAFDTLSPVGSVLIVPKVLVGRRNGVSWVTSVELVSGGDCEGSDGLRRVVSTLRHAQGGPIPTTASTRERWYHIISQSLAMLDEGRDGLRKVVLARAEDVPGAGPIPPLPILRDLGARYPETWTFAVDGLIGATPELLVRAIDGEVQSRVLAGTKKRADDDAAAFVANPKEATEHRIAVESVVSALAPFCAALEYAEMPEVLELPNVWHLATDISGKLAERQSVLALVGALHPTAAVCGWPRSAALNVIRELEGFDRGRYAGPVGWVDAEGNGEWGIALRCGDLGGRSPRIYAGCGIVPGSDPVAEWAESEAKLLPMRQALSSLGR